MEQTIQDDVYFVQQGTAFFTRNKMNELIHPVLPGGNFSIKFTPQTGYYLEKIADFKEPAKLYGNVRTTAGRIINSFQAKTGNLGVVLYGEKGSGKTLLGRQISKQAADKGIPTLFINSAMTGQGFFEFLYKIQQECIIFIDEYEKIYDKSEQEELLTVLDGVFQSKKLFILTCNDKYKLDIHLRNRPGRIHYMLEFNGLDSSFVREYCQDALQDKGKTEDVVNVCSLFTTLNFDMLQALVWEMNLYKESPMDAITMLNAKPEGEVDIVYTTVVSQEGHSLVRTGNDLSSDGFRGSPFKLNKGFGLYFTEEDLETLAKESPEKKLMGTNHFSSDILKILKNKDKTIVDGDQVLAEIYFEQFHGENGGVYYLTDFKPEHLVGLEVKTGNYVFKNEKGLTLTLTRQKDKSMTVQEMFDRAF